MKDIFEREIKIGDYIAAPTSSKYKGTHLRVGRVVNITENGNISIRARIEDKWDYRIGRAKTWKVKTVTLFVAPFMILSKDNIPNDILLELESDK
jgi:hypothetical protein